MEHQTIKQINTYLNSVGWRGSSIQWVGGEFNYETRTWNSFDTNEEAYGWFKKHRGEMFESIKAEFQAKQNIGVCYCGKCSKCMYG